MVALTKSVLSIGALCSSAVAWSSSGPDPSSNRRGFLQNAQKAAVAIGTASVSGGSVFVENAQAATSGTTSKSKIYQPVPGSLSGQVHVITGASSGLGLESAKRLAAAGAIVVMTTRSAAKAEMAKSQVQSYLQERSINTNDQDNIHVLTLDMDDLADVRSFPDRYSKALGSRKIDVLMNNAGALIKSRETSKDGFEKTFQSNHLGPFLLTSALFPQMNRNGSRIVNVASMAHNFAKETQSGKQGLDMNNLNGEVCYGLDGWEAYGNTKLENILFTQELQRKANDAGLSWLTAVSLHPGVVGTDFFRDTPFAKGDSFTSGLLYKGVLSNEEGANTQVMLASDSGISKGRFYDEHGRVFNLAPFARDEVKARELWEVSESLSSCKFNVV